MATLLAPISASFSSLQDLSWLASAYLIANAASQPLSGRLTDIFGRRAGLLFCNATFGIGTLLCGVAPRMSILILGRVIAGLGGGALVTILTIVISDLVPLRKRGVVQGINNISVGIGTGSGGFLGGWINSMWGWRWAFLVQVPFIGVATLLVFLVVKFEAGTQIIKPKSALMRIDFAGSFTLLAALILLLLGLNSGGNVLPWTHPLVLIALLLSIPFAMAFVYIENEVASEPIIPVRLLLNRTVAAVCLTYLFTNMAFYAVLYYLPIYIQVLNRSTAEAGLRLIPQSVGTTVGALASGLTIRALGRYYHLNTVTQVVSIIGYASLCTLSRTSEPWRPFVYLGLVGLGYGGMLVISLLALVSSVEQEHQATITSASFAFRSIGSTLGVTGASAVFQNALRSELRLKLAGGSTYDGEDARQIIDRLVKNFDELRRLGSLALRQRAVDSYMIAVQDVFLFALVFISLAAAASFFMREHKLYDNLARR